MSIREYLIKKLSLHTTVIISAIKKWSAMQSRERTIDTLSVRRPQDHNSKAQKERSEREEQYETKRERVADAYKKPFTMFLKSANPTQSKRGSASLFHRYTENGIKVL